MKAFEIKSTHRQALQILSIVYAVVLTEAGSTFLPGISHYNYGPLGVVILVALLVTGIIYLRNRLTITYTIEVSENEVTILRGGRVRATTHIGDITRLQLKEKANSCRINLYTLGNRKIFATFDTVGQQQVINDILAEIVKHGQYTLQTEGNAAGGIRKTYINKYIIGINPRSFYSPRTQYGKALTEF